MKFKYLLLLVFVSFFTFKIASAEEVQIDLTNGYANDVWFSIEKGVTGSESKDNWDIAFQNGSSAGGVRLNGQKGLNMWVIPTSIKLRVKIMYLQS